MDIVTNDELQKKSEIESERFRDNFITQFGLEKEEDLIAFMKSQEIILIASEESCKLEDYFREEIMLKHANMPTSEYKDLYKVAITKFHQLGMCKLIRELNTKEEMIKYLEDNLDEIKKYILKIIKCWGTK